MGTYREDSTEGGVRAGCLGKVLLRGDTGSVVIWGGDLGVVGANGAEAGGSSFWFPETGENFEGKNSEGRLVEKGGGRQSDSGSGDTTAPELIGQEEGNSGRMGGREAYI